MTDLKVVTLRETPSLQNVPALLRALADRIESGEQDARTLFVVVPRDGEFPEVYGWGDVDGNRDPMIQLALVQHWLCTNLVKRAGT